MESFQNNINDESLKVLGKTLCITTHGDHAFSLNIKSGLPYMNIRLCTDNKWKILPHVILTSDDERDPTILEYSTDDNDANNDEWYDAISDDSTKHNDTLFDSTGEISIDT